MNILIHWVQYDAGGVDTQIAEMIKCWPDKKDIFTIVYNSKNKGLLRIQSELSHYNVKYEEILWNESNGKVLSCFKLIFHPIHFFILVLKSFFHLNKLAKSHHAIIVQAGTYPGSLLSLASIVASKWLNISKRMLVIHHGAVHGNMLKKPFEGLIDRLMHKFCTDIVAVSLATRESLILQRGFDPSINPIRLIYNGISVDSQHEGKVDLRKIYNIDKSKIIIGMVGRIERYKGHEDLLRALSLLSKPNQERFQILMIGGASEDEINRLNKISKFLNISSLVTFTGYIEGNSIDVIRELDLLAMLTKDFEGFGLTAAEAMFANTPLIATKVGAVEEFINISIASLVPPECPYELSVVLNQYLMLKEQFLEKASFAKHHIGKFSGNRMAQEYKYLLSL